MTKLRLFTIVLVGVFAAGIPLRAQNASKASGLLTSKQVKELVANAKTPADHMKLNKHFLALAAKYEAESTDHVDLAKVYRKNPGASETKRPLAPDTAAHCDRFAEVTRDAAKAARDLAADHERMAAAK